MVVGRVVAPWGVNGDLKVEVHSDSPDRFRAGSVIYLDGKPSVVQRSRPAKDMLLVKLDTVSGRTQAESLRGSSLTAPTSDAPSLPEGSYYYFQIIGMDVWTDAGGYLGKVREILPAGGTHVYVAMDEDGGETLLPAHSDVILEVDVTENRMTARIPEGPS